MKKVYFDANFRVNIIRQKKKKLHIGRLLKFYTKRGQNQQSWSVIIIHLQNLTNIKNVITKKKIFLLEITQYFSGT